MDANRLARLTRPTGLVLWLVVAATVLSRRYDSPRSTPWAIAWAIGFTACLATSVLRIPRAVALLAQGIQVVMVAWLTALFANGFEGLLLVPIALEVWFLLPPSSASTWVLLQNALFASGLALHRGTWSACLWALPYSAVQLLVLGASIAFAREQSLRAELASAHQELLALRPVLEEGSRNAERVRLSRELHDATGHRLTALALQLEVASHTASGPVLAPIEKAKSMVRELIDDMRRIVTATDLTDSEGLAGALRELAQNFPRPTIHLAIPERLRVADAERAHVLLRCSQEILTNSARHSGARNLWLEITQDDAELRLHARDDGTTGSEIRAGSGLRGMKRRFEGLGGTLRYSFAAEGGLEILASLPNQAV